MLERAADGQSDAVAGWAGGGRKLQVDARIGCLVTAAGVASKASISQAHALEIINHIFAAEPGRGVIAIELGGGSNVSIPGFGTFRTACRDNQSGKISSCTKTGTNETRIVKFLASSDLKARVKDIYTVTDVECGAKCKFASTDATALQAKTTEITKKKAPSKSEPGKKTKISMPTLQLHALLANAAKLSTAKAAEIINIIFSTTPGTGIIAIELDAGRKVQIAGFGTFATKHRGERVGKNPSTGEAITIAAKTYPVFKPAKGLKDRVAD